MDGNGRDWRTRSVALRQAAAGGSCNSDHTHRHSDANSDNDARTNIHQHADPNEHASAHQYTNAASDPHADSHQHTYTNGHSAASGDTHAHCQFHSHRDLYTHIDSARVRACRTHADGRRERTRSLLHSYPYA